METQNQNSNPENKQEFELKKLQLEIIELEKPWFKKPSFFVPLIGALSSILVLWITGFFNVNIDKLNLKREMLQFDIEKGEKKLQILKDSLNIATKPNLTIQTIAVTSEEKIGIQVQNTGTGTAYFKHFNIIYKGRKFIDINEIDDFKEIIFEMNHILEESKDEIFTIYEVKKLDNSYEKAGSLGPGQEYFPLRLSKNRYSDDKAEKFLKAIEGMEIEIEYYSIKGKTYVVKKQLELHEILR